MKLNLNTIVVVGMIAAGLISFLRAAFGMDVGDNVLLGCLFLVLADFIHDDSDAKREKVRTILRRERVATDELVDEIVEATK